ncbi:alginate O-acetyltransferase AlgF [Alteromonas sediminis]|uniref:alginate O-acetyltransferase AlgF n=1 Tax=Alteromonas sediminis TaxID=2259342 RepID=UPI00140542CA|nr:alginate O-acetyltransferase AlgF [Alteromonas sediminis]
MKARVVILIMVCLFCSVVSADEALYGPAPPPDAAFFRLLNLSDSEVALQVSEGMSIDVNALEITEYGYLPASEIQLKVNEKSIADGLQPGQQLTLVYFGNQGGSIVIEDTPFDNKRMALLRLYNVSHNDDLSMKTLNGKTTILDNIAFKSSKERVIKAVKLPVALYRGETRVIESEPLLLQKNRVTSVFAIQNENGTSLLITESEQ